MIIDDLAGMFGLSGPVAIAVFAVFMAFMTLWAAVMNQVKFGSAHNMLLQVINIAIIVIAVWIVIEGLIKFFSTDDTGLGEAHPAASS